MKMVIFDQWEALVKRFRSIASASAESANRYALVSLDSSSGSAKLTDHAINTSVVSGGAVKFTVPDIEPGKARDFMLRLKATAETEISFAGADAFESDDPDVFGAVYEGETVLIYFTETEGDVFSVARKNVETI